MFDRFKSRDVGREFRQYQSGANMERIPDFPERDTSSTEPVRARGTMDIDVKQVGPFRRGLCGMFGILALVAFVSTFAMAFVFMPALEDHDLEWILIACFGGIFMFAGLAIWSGGAGLFPLLFAAVGCVVFSAALVFGMGGEAMQEFMMSQGVPLLAGFAFVAAGAGLLVVPRILHAKRKSRYTMPVTARVVDKQKRISHDSDGHRRTCYYLTWKYVAGGREYTYHSNFGRSPERREPGHVGQLMLDPDDLGRVWEGADGTSMALLSVLGVAFMAAGCFVVLAILGIF